MISTVPQAINTIPNSKKVILKKFVSSLFTKVNLSIYMPPFWIPEFIRSKSQPIEKPNTSITKSMHRVPGFIRFTKQTFPEFVFQRPIFRSFFKSFSTMHLCVFANRHKYKIFQTIIQFILVFMVNIFMAFKLSSKIFLHYKSMFQHSFSWGNCNNAVSTAYAPSKVFSALKRCIWISISFIPTVMIHAKAIGFSLFFTTFNRAVSFSNETCSRAKSSINSFMKKWFGAFFANMLVFH